jgi:hypothetical protein
VHFPGAQKEAKKGGVLQDQPLFVGIPLLQTPTLASDMGTAALGEKYMLWENKMIFNSIVKHR